MKHMLLWVIAASLAGGALAQPDTATTKPAKNARNKASTAKGAAAAAEKPQAAKPESIKFSMGMLEAGRIDPSFVGLSVQDVITAIEKLGAFKKGEFESTADFNARKSVALSAKFLDGASVEDLFAFSVSVAKGGRYADGLRYTFNADTSEASLFALPTSSKYTALNGIGAPDYATNRQEFKGLDQFKLATKLEASSTYEGSNAYGAKVTVQKNIVSVYGIAANRIPFLRFEREMTYGNPTAEVLLKMDNGTAAAELPSLRALIIMKLAAPYVAYNFMHKEPTRDSPTEFAAQEKYLTGDVLGIVYYSGKSGDVLARLPERFGMAEPQPEGRP